MNKLNYAAARTGIAFILFIVMNAIFCGPSYAGELQAGGRYKIIRPVYLIAAYNSLDNKQISRETARAYLESMQIHKRSWMAFQHEVPAGTIMTILGPAPKVWRMTLPLKNVFLN